MDVRVAPEPACVRTSSTCIPRRARRWHVLRILALAAGIAASQAAPGAGSLAWAQEDKDLTQLVEAGKNLYRAGEYDQAIAKFKQAVAIDPANFDAAFGLGRTLERVDRQGEAAAVYESMLTSLPDRPEPHYRLGIVYRKLRKYELSIAAYRRYITARPEDPDPYYGLGESLREMGDATGAIKAFTRYNELETRPDEQKYVEQAKAYIVELEAKAAPAEAPTEAPATDLGEKAVHTPDAQEPTLVQPQEAPTSVLAATAPDAPPIVDVRAALAEADAVFAGGDAVAAAQRYHSITQSAPSSLEAFYKLGVALAVAGDAGAAIDAWERAEALDASFTASRENIERAKRRLAVSAVIDSPGMAGAADERKALAQQYYDATRYQMALRAARALLLTAPAEPIGHRLAAMAYLAMAAPQLALESLTTELALQPGDFRLFVLLGQAHEMLGDTEQAAYFYALYLDTVDPDGTDPTLAEIRARVTRLRTAQPDEG